MEAVHGGHIGLNMNLSQGVVPGGTAGSGRGDTWNCQVEVPPPAAPPAVSPGMKRPESRKTAPEKLASGRPRTEQDSDGPEGEKNFQENQESICPSNNSHQSQMEATLEWLETNYERADGVCLPRCVLYSHYLHLCKQRGFSPVGAATFGKIIRQRFPKITTRRLGTRGQSKYHYYGIGIKEGSIYYHSVYSGKGLTRFSGTKVKTEGSNRKYTLSSKTGTLLPEFPKASDLVLRPGVQRDKVETFSVMYRTHCQRILDTVINANFEEVQSFLLHFWQGMPAHLEELLTEQVITDLVALCDSVLYKVLTDVLIPTTIQDIPDSLCAEIKVFIRRLPVWLKNCLEGIPENITTKKLEAARHFTQSIRRQISFIQLAQTSRTVLQSSETVDQMMTDLDLLEFDRLCLQVAPLQRDCLKSVSTTVRKFFDEFRCLLKKQAAIESFIEWIDNMIDANVIQPATFSGSSLQNESSQRKFQSDAAAFLLQWSIFSSFLLRDLTLSNAESFGSFHVLHMTFSEYVFLVMETQQASIRESQQKRHVTSFLRNAGELSLQARQRPTPPRGSSTPPHKRRKEETSSRQDTYPASSQDEDSQSRSDQPSPPSVSDCDHVTQGLEHDGSISRLMPAKEPHRLGTYSEVSSAKSQYLHPPPGSPLKPATPSGGGNGYNVPSVQSMGFNTYPQDLGHLPAPRLQSYNTESQTHAQNGFNAVPPLQATGFNMAATASCSVPTATYTTPSASTYWNDTGRCAPSGLGENYQGGFAAYGTKYGSQYEVFPWGAAPYPDPARSAPYSDPGLPGLYPGRVPCDTGLAATTITGGAFGMPSYSGNMNYLDHVMPPGTQYRQESLMGNPHQETQDFYPGGFPSSMTSLNKTFMTPFR